MEPSTSAPTTGSVPQYIKQHGLAVYIQDAVSLIVANPDLDPAKFMAEYLVAVVSGQHVVSRHFAYVAASAFNRRIFLVTARKALQQLSRAGLLSQGDCHSALQLLCPDLPSSAVRNAWSSAVAIQADLPTQQQQHQPQQPNVGQPPQPEEESAVQQGPLVAIEVFMHCFAVTFLYEHYLMAVRRGAFNEAKQCISMEAVEHSMMAASEQLPPLGWPVPPHYSVWQVVTKLSGGGANVTFSFGDVVKGLCANADLKALMQSEDAAMIAAATAAAEANTAKQGEQSGGEEDNDVDDVLMGRQISHRYSGLLGGRRGSDSTAVGGSRLGSASRTDSKRSWR